MIPCNNKSKLPASFTGATQFARFLPNGSCYLDSAVYRIMKPQHPGSRLCFGPWALIGLHEVIQITEKHTHMLHTFKGPTGIYISIHKGS